MADHITLPLNDRFLMMNPLVIAQNIALLRQGRFDRQLGLVGVVKFALTRK